MTDPPLPMLAVIAEGQSLATGGGWRALPPGERAVSVMPPDPAHLFMLDTGTITGSLEPIDASRITALVPIREDPDRGESQGTAMLRMLAHLRAGGRGDQDWLYLNHAVAGQPMAMLVGDAVAQANGVAQLAAADRLVRSLGRSMRVLATTWSHGEADRKLAVRNARRGRAAPAGALRETYRRRLIAHHRAAAAQYQAVTGQGEPIWMLIDQLGAPAAADGEELPEITLAQFDAALAGERIALSCPRYFFRPPFGYLDNVHLVPLGYAVLGEYHAKAIALLGRGDAADDGRGCCLQPDPASLRRDGRVLRLRLQGGRGPLVIDAETLSPAPGLGFAWAPQAGSGTIADVRLEGDEVVIELTAGGPGRLSYAVAVAPGAGAGRAQAWGNLRDSDPIESLALPGLMLRNWLVAFEFALG